MHEKYVQRFNDACDAQDPTMASQVLKEAFADSQMTEMDLGLLCTAVFDRRFDYAFVGALQAFNHKFPISIFPVQAFFAILLTMQNHYEQASEEARFYLRKAKDAGLFEKTERSLVFEAGLASAFLALTAMYTECGARDYSKRVLAYGLQKLKKGRQQESLEREILRLENELEDSQAAAVNQRWEDFFSTGTGAVPLIQFAKDKEFELLAKRIELLEAALKQGAKRPFEEELFQLIYFGEREGQQYAVFR